VLNHPEADKVASFNRAARSPAKRTRGEYHESRAQERAAAPRHAAHLHRIRHHFGSVLSGLPSAQAEPPTVTTVKYYTVNATTAQSLDQQMIARGPVHGPGRAYANIVARPDYSGRLVQGQSCRLEDFTVRAEFTMTLPKLSAGVQLSPT
jgi:predicted secreted Zn-dependent protease